MKLNYKNREFIIKVCEGCNSYHQASVVCDILVKFAEQKRVKKITQDLILEFKSLCLCEVVGHNRESQYEKYAQELAINFIKAIDDDNEKVYNMFKLNVERSRQNGIYNKNN